MLPKHSQENELNEEILEKVPFETLNWCKAEKNFNKLNMYKLNMSVSDSIEDDEENESEFHILCRKRWTK